MSVVLEFKRPEPPVPAKPAKAGKKIWRHPTKEYVRAEAVAWIAVAGAPNVYMRYLKLYGRYPAPQQATAMGLKLGLRVRADDGKLYPPRSKAEKQHDKDVRARRKESYRVLQGIFDAQYALQHLVRIGATADEIIDYCDGDGVMFRDNTAIDRDVDAALSWLQGFAAEWRRRHPIKQDV